MFTLRLYQQLARKDAAAVLRDGGRRMYAAPTGTGKSLIELALLADFPSAWLITPRVEIIADMLRKLGIDSENPESDGEANRIITPIRLRNRLLAGGAPPARLILDEAHHDEANSWQDLHALCGYCPCVGFTATPFRGTPKGTASFRERWGEPVWVITMREAVAGGHLAFPTCTIWPLVDDDVCELSNGDFVISSVEAETRNRLAAIVERCLPFLRRGGPYGVEWDRPTMFSVPSTAIAEEFYERANRACLPCSIVTQTTPRERRQLAFRQCVAREAALVQIQVVSEGVDLPIRRLIDVSPSISPVKWLQQVGRITRPTDTPPEYICTNRNLLRHAYLLEGLLPQSKYIEAQEAFAVPSSRAGIRVVGLEALGRLKPAPFVTASGVQCSLYAISTMEDNVKVEYAAILHPLLEQPLWVVKESPHDGTQRTYGRWRQVEPPADLHGFASIPGSKITEPMSNFWNRCARSVGLDVKQEVNRKNFIVLPILKDIGGKMT
jgi:superfamily II DNA or RNA helicase